MDSITQVISSLRCPGGGAEFLTRPFEGTIGGLGVDHMRIINSPRHILGAWLIGTSAFGALFVLQSALGSPPRSRLWGLVILGAMAPWCLLFWRLRLLDQWEGLARIWRLPLQAVLLVLFAVGLLLILLGGVLPLKHWIVRMGWWLTCGFGGGYVIGWAFALQSRRVNDSTS